MGILKGRNFYFNWLRGSAECRSLTVGGDRQDEGNTTNIVFVEKKDRNWG